jgi:hypothetical protein
MLHTLPWLLACQPINAEQRAQMEELLWALADVLPCIYCRQSYRIFLCAYPPKCATAHRVTLAHWLYRCHNLVNLKLEKPLERNFLTACEACASCLEELSVALFDVLFVLALNYPENPQGAEAQRRRKEYKRFLSALTRLLPQLLSADGMDEALASRQALIDWIYLARSKAPGLTPQALPELLSTYERVRAGQKEKPPTAFDTQPTRVLLA